MRALLFALAALLCAAAHGQGSVSPEEVKAAFLLRFAGFVDWPSSARPDERLVIGVVDGSEVEAELRRFVAARQGPVVRSVESPSDLAGIHILFVGSRDPGRVSRWIGAARALPILVVTDAPEALERGSMINFVTTDRVQFEASADAAQRSGLRLNPRLLSVATRVKKGEFGSETPFAARRGAWRTST